MTTVDELQKKLDQTTQELHKTLDDHWMLNAQLLAAKHDLREAQAKLGSVRQSIADALPEEVAHMPLVEGAQTVVAQNAALRAERDRYEAALVARHGGEPVELLRELDAAHAEVERLTKELARWQKSFAGHVYVKNEDYSALVDRAETAVKSAERLREALREIEEGATSTYEDAWCGDIARAALAGKETP